MNFLSREIESASTHAGQPLRFAGDADDGSRVDWASSMLSSAPVIFN
jgi:hypothetical protein